MNYETDLISLLIPTRKRPNNLLRLVESIENTASNKKKIEVLFYVDEDDDTFPKDLLGINFKIIRGPRIWLSLAVNTLYVHSKGEILMPGGDDMIFQTFGWDREVRDSFNRSPDKINIVYANELGWHGEKIAIHGFIHRKWVQTVGACVAPGRLSAYDRWVTDVARKLGRLEFREDIEIPHLHYRQSKIKAPFDETYRSVNAERRSFQSLVTYSKMERERRIDRILLAEVMHKPPKWELRYWLGEFIASLLKEENNIFNLDQRRLRTMTNFEVIFLVIKRLIFWPFRRLLSRLQ
jgi:glycosyltransferase involved in cell wall biosynthesis